MIEQHAVTLFELLNTVRSELKSAFTETVWVVAEIMECNINRNGHCYLEFVEKDADSERMIAKARATIWSNVAAGVLPFFESVTGQTLHSGMKIMARVTVEMHELYGFSLNIQDIDPQYTLGDIAQQRAKVIAQLEADGVIDMNKQLEMPLVVQRVAVISSDTAAGWGDFKNQIDNNIYGYSFYVELFPALVQGEGASASIIDSLERIYSRVSDFDAVAIIRGGGSKSDLSCFDQYDLAYYAAQYPLPIITGIGHERDNSVLDMVANERLKTPTALAAFLIDRAAGFEQRLVEMCQSVFSDARSRIDGCIQSVTRDANRFVYAAKTNINRCAERVENLKYKLQNADRIYFNERIHRLGNLEQQSKLTGKMQIMAAANNTAHLQLRFEKAVVTYFETQQKQLEHFENVVDKYNPQKILERGYAIVTAGGKTVKSPADVKSGDELAIRTKGGVIEGVVK